jgi:ferredoxin-NADP reductase
VTDLLASHPVSADSEAYLCGPPPMIERSAELLRQRGLIPDNIHFEIFKPAQQRSDRAT